MNGRARATALVQGEGHRPVFAGALILLTLLLAGLLLLLTRTMPRPADRYDWGAVLIAAALALAMPLLDVRLWWAMAIAILIGALVVLLRSRA